jgi:hypothetical protein
MGVLPCRPAGDSHPEKSSYSPLFLTKTAFAESAANRARGRQKTHKTGQFVAQKSLIHSLQPLRAAQNLVIRSTSLPRPTTGILRNSELLTSYSQRMSLPAFAAAGGGC